MIHLPPKVATLLRGAGEGSLSLGIIRLADVHQGIPLTPTPVRTRRRNPTATARRRAIAALEDLKQKLLVEP